MATKNHHSRPFVSSSAGGGVAAPSLPVSAAARSLLAVAARRAVGRLGLYKPARDDCSSLRVGLALRLHQWFPGFG